MSIIGNSIVLTAILRTRKLHTVTNVFVGNLAVADIAVGFLVAPLAALSFKGLPRNFYGCVLVNSLILLFTNVSIFMLLAVALERFVAIKEPFMYQRVMTLRRAVMYNIAVWVLGTVLGLVPMYGWNSGNKQLESCQFTAVITYEYMVYFQFFGLVLLPLFLMLCVYIYILFIVRHHTRQSNALLRHIQLNNPDSIESSSRTRQSRVSRDERKFNQDVRAAKMFALLILLFGVFWLPINIFNCVSLFCGPDCNFTYEALLVAIVMSHANSSINPLVYAASNSHIKRAIKKMFGQGGSVYDSSTDMQQGGRSSTGVIANRNQVIHDTYDQNGTSLSKNYTGSSPVFNEVGRFTSAVAAVQEEHYPEPRSTIASLDSHRSFDSRRSRRTSDLQSEVDPQEFTREGGLLRFSLGNASSNNIFFMKTLSLPPIPPPHSISHGANTHQPQTSPKHTPDIRREASPRRSLSSPQTHAHPLQLVALFRRNSEPELQHLPRLTHTQVRSSFQHDKKSRLPPGNSNLSGFPPPDPSCYQSHTNYGFIRDSDSDGEHNESSDIHLHVNQSGHSVKGNPRTNGYTSVTSLGESSVKRSSRPNGHISITSLGECSVMGNPRTNGYTSITSLGQTSISPYRCGVSSPEFLPVRDLGVSLATKPETGVTPPPPVKRVSFFDSRASLKSPSLVLEVEESGMLRNKRTEHTKL
ncbi:adenosine receptor a1-like [Plakobranchus ocellatus]|uniref:Adenosine receptor a1-like n=1 Tax=Plakobranchus ocellatus TaxID=259542 RepID=A0AAV4BF61_9GAST|nr:adenosine receptor a1-like [Plakobranchus ocellatus]